MHDRGIVGFAGDSHKLIANIQRAPVSSEPLALVQRSQNLVNWAGMLFAAFVIL